MKALIDRIIDKFRNRMEGYETWVCPKCKRKYKTPRPNIPRIAAYVQKWDFCPKCLIDRETGGPMPFSPYGKGESDESTD